MSETTSLLQQFAARYDADDVRRDAIRFLDDFLLVNTRVTARKLASFSDFNVSTQLATEVIEQAVVEGILQPERRRKGLVAKVAGPKRNISINLPEAYDASIDRLIAVGEYPSRSEAIRVALRDFLERERTNLSLMGVTTDG